MSHALPRTLTGAPTATAVLDRARHYIGLHEGRDPNGAWNNMQKFGAEYGMNGVPWCQIFIWCVMFESGGAGLLLRTAGCAEEYNWFRRHKATGTEPQTGALIYFGPNAGVHVGIVESYDSTHVVYISGNTGDASAGPGVGNAVERKSIARGARWIAGYAYPAYGSSGPKPRLRDLRLWRVKKGQTLAGIAASAGISLAALFGLNPGLVSHANMIHPGDVVTLPATAAPHPTVTVTTTAHRPVKCPPPKPKPRPKHTPTATPRRSP